MPDGSLEHLARVTISSCSVLRAGEVAGRPGGGSFFGRSGRLPAPLPWRASRHSVHPIFLHPAGRHLGQFEVAKEGEEVQP